MLERKSRHEHGRVAFTASELVVILVVFVLLAGVISPTFGHVIEEARKVRALNECRAIAAALGVYREEVGGYPPGVQDDPSCNYANAKYFGFGAEVLNPWLWSGGKHYLRAPIGLDPWGTPYNYHVYTRTEPFLDVVVFSNGPNHVCESWNAELWNQGHFAGDDIGAFYDFAH